MSTRNSKIVAQVKDSFLTLCEQFSRMGELLQANAKILVDKGLWDGSAGVAMGPELAQYHEIGEQLKTLGTGIDLMGDKPVLQPGKGMRVVSGTPKELKERGYNVSQFIPGWPGKDGE